MSFKIIARCQNMGDKSLIKKTRISIKKDMDVIYQKLDLRKNMKDDPCDDWWMSFNFRIGKHLMRHAPGTPYDPQFDLCDDCSHWRFK